MNKIEFDLKKESLFPLVAFLIAFGLLYGRTIISMINHWSMDENYSHGFLIPFITAYMLWERKDNMKSVVTTPSNYGLFLIFAGLGLFLVGTISSELFTMRFSMLLVLAGVLLFVFGIGFFKAILFPFCYLILMIPIPYIIYDAIAFPLKVFVSKYSVDFLGFVGILALREGNIIHLADITLEVADACSGVRSILSLLALSMALAYFTQKGLLKRTVLVVLAVPIAILVNAIRVIGTGVLANQYGAKVAEGFFHEFAGIVIFGSAIVLLIFSTIILGKIGKN